MLWSWMVWGLVACGAADKDTGAGADSAADCAETVGALSGEVVEEVDVGVFEPMSGATVMVAQGGGGVIETLTDDEGRFRLSLEAGEYILSAANGDETCFTSEPQTVTIAACGTSEVTLEMDLWAGR